MWLNFYQLHGVETQLGEICKFSNFSAEYSFLFPLVQKV